MSRTLPVVLPARHERRLVAYLGVATLGVMIGMLATEPGAMSVGVAAALWAAVTMRDAAPARVEVELERADDVVLVGDAASVEVRATIPLGYDAQLELVDRERTGLRVVDTSTTEATLRLVAAVPTDEWGRRDLGHLAIRLTRPGRALVWQTDRVELGRITVLPRREQLDALLAPQLARSATGVHRSRHGIGSGSEFAEIRAYLPGDRLRDVNWTATARRRSPQVNRYEPERGGDVIIVLDAVPDIGRYPSQFTRLLLQYTGQVGWALARRHLAAGDRVGLLVQRQRDVSWLPPRGGRRAQYQLLEHLLRSTDQRSSVDRIGQRVVPPSSLVIGISSLNHHGTLLELAALRIHGRQVGVLAIDERGLLAGRIDHRTARLATMTATARAAYLQRLSTPVAWWCPGDPIERVLAQLDEQMHRSRVGTGTR